MQREAYDNFRMQIKHAILRPHIYEAWVFQYEKTIYLQF